MPNNCLSPLAQEVIPLAQRSIAAASIGSSYTLVTSLFATGVTLLYIVSTLDQHVQLSFDGVVDFIPCLANSAITFDFRSDNSALPGKYGIYVKEIGNPASGNLYVSAISI